MQFFFQAVRGLGKELLPLAEGFIFLIIVSNWRNTENHCKNIQLQYFHRNDLKNSRLFKTAPNDIRIKYHKKKVCFETPN